MYVCTRGVCGAIMMMEKARGGRKTLEARVHFVGFQAWKSEARERDESISKLQSEQSPEMTMEPRV